jgi:hypothetical protein
LVAEYRHWLENNAGTDSTLVLDYVHSLRATLKRIELLGLTRQELEGSKAQIYGSVLRARLNVEPEFLRALVEGMPEGDLFEIKNDPATLSHLQAAFFQRVMGTGL